MEIFPQSTKCINHDSLITKEFTGPEYFDIITRVTVRLIQLTSHINT